MDMKFDVISHVVAKVKSDNFLIALTGSTQDCSPIVSIESETDEFEFTIDELDELIQALILFKDNNKSAKS